MIRHLFLCFFALLLLSACVKEGEVDRDPPEFEVISWTPTPQEAMICGALESIVFQVTDKDTIRMLVDFRDEGGLSEVKVDIHNNFDCHGHRSQTSDWFLQQIIPLSGTQMSKEILLPVPQNATAGNYHFGLLVSDLSGNVTDQTFFYSIQVTNHRDSIAPVLTLLQPALQDTPIAVTRGSQLRLQGFLRDNQPLNIGGNAGIDLFSRRAMGGNTMTQHQIDLSAHNNEEYGFDFTFTIPQVWVRDVYELLLVGYDGVRNESNTIRILVRAE